MTERRSIKKNYFYNSLLVGLRMLFPLITYPYVLRVLGPENVGKVNFAISFAMYFSIVASLGIPQYGIREIARARDDREETSRAFSELLIVNMGAMLVTLLIYSSCFFFVDKMNTDVTLFLMVGIIILLNPFAIEWLYAGFENYRYIALRSIVFKVISVAALFVFVKGPGDYRVYAGITVFAGFGSHLVNMLYSRKFVTFTFRGLDLRRHIKPVMFLFSATFIASVYTRFDIVLLGFLGGDRNVAFYNVDRKLIMMGVSVISALSLVLIPRLSYYFNKGMKDEFAKLAEKSVNFIYFMGLPLSAGVIMLAPEMLHIFGGVKFVQGTLSLRLIAPLILLESLNNFLALQILLPTGNERKITRANVVAAAVNFGLNMALIPLYLHNGTAAVITATHLILFVVLYQMARREINFKLFGRRGMRYLIGTALLVITVFGVKSLGRGTVFTFCASVASAVTVYGFFLLASGDEFVKLSLRAVGKGLDSFKRTYPEILEDEE